MAKHTSLLIVCGFGLAACAPERVPTQRPVDDQLVKPIELTPAAAEAPFGASTASTSEEAHRLVIEAVACWFGDIGTDTPSVDDANRANDTGRRCRHLFEAVYGTYDQVRCDRLRAVEPTEVSDLKARILAVARLDALDRPREQQLGALLEAFANAARESVLARRAASRVKADSERDREGIKLTLDEVAAVGPLNDARAFEALLALDMGQLSLEARAVAIMYAIERMQTARGLSEHLRIYALARPFAVLFGTITPALPVDGRQPIADGTWISYISGVAAAAEHPVPATAKKTSERELLAWEGTLEGLADKLRDDVRQMSYETDLKQISAALVARIDAEYRATQAAVAPQLERNGAVPSRWPPAG